MIFIDRIFRYFAKDIFLPNRCYASKKQMFAPNSRCDCHIFCNKTPGGRPAMQAVLTKNNQDSRKYYYHTINEKHKQ